MNRQEKAQELLQYFEQKTRDNGFKFYSCKDNTPEYVTDLIHQAHDDMMPDDWKYEFVYDALEIISDTESEDDYFERIDSDVNVYTHDLLRWLSSNLNRSYYLQDAIEEGEKDIFKLYMIAQFKEREEVFNSVLSSIDDLIKEEE